MMSHTLFRTTSAGLWEIPNTRSFSGNLWLHPGFGELLWAQSHCTQQEVSHLISKPSLPWNKRQVHILGSLYGVVSPKTGGIWVHLPCCQFCTHPTCLCSNLTWHESYSAQAAMTKYHRWCDLNSRYLLSHPSGSQKSMTKVPSGLVSGEVSLPGLQMATFLLCPQTPFLWACVRRGLWCLFLLKGHHPYWMRVPPNDLI